MIIRMIGSNKDLLKFFLENGLSTNQISKLFGFPESVFNSVLAGLSDLSKVQRENLINLYLYMQIHREE